MAEPAEDLAQALEAWREWLQGRLDPNDVSFAGVSSSPGSETRWRIRFRTGRESWLYIPTYLVGSGDDVFEWVTMGMETYDWILLLRRGEANEFEVNRNGMLLARRTGKGAA